MILVSLFFCNWHWHFCHFLVSIIWHLVHILAMDEDITNKPLMLPGSVTSIVWSPDFSLRMWTLSNSLRWRIVDTVSHFTHFKLAPVTSPRWWMLVIPSLIFKGDDNLQSIMFTMNVSILPALHQARCAATWWWNDVVGTLSTLIIIRSAPQENLNIGV